jgi:hypothetical protein
MFDEHSDSGSLPAGGTTLLGRLLAARVDVIDFDAAWAYTAGLMDGWYRRRRGQNWACGRAAWLLFVIAAVVAVAFQFSTGSIQAAVILLAVSAFCCWLARTGQQEVTRLQSKLRWDPDCPTPNRLQSVEDQATAAVPEVQVTVGLFYRLVPNDRNGSVALEERWVMWARLPGGGESDQVCLGIWDHHFRRLPRPELGVLQLSAPSPDAR